MGAKVYPSAAVPPIEHAVLIIEDGKIRTVFAGDHGKPDVPRSATMLPCAGKVVVAGFWNSHVHFETGWDRAAGRPAPELERQLRDMLTRWGFTTVWDLGSNPDDTLALRRRVNAGEIAGPRILMAGDIFPKNGHPVYLPAEMQLPEAATPQEADAMARRYLQMGLDGVKLFTGVFMGDKPVINMDTAIVKAAVDVAHAQGKPVFAHPQNWTGLDNALAGGVNILAHTIPTDQPREGGFSAEEFARMQRQHTALIPTLTLWTTVTSDQAVVDKLEMVTVGQLKAFHAHGGTVLFGTDVGFTSKYDTSEEFALMGRALSWQDILASLTTNPSNYFKAEDRGQVKPGMQADLVVLQADPALDVRNLAKVAYTIRGGKLIYRADK
jgi:imidazolonepropionase-like amidohydrolase